MTKPLKSSERFCNTPPSAVLAAAEFAGRCSGPFLEGSMERAALGKTELQGDIDHTAVRVAEIADREVAAQLILDALIGGAFLMQPPAQGRGGHVQFGGERLEIRYLPGEPLPEAPADARAHAAAVLVLGHDVLGSRAQELLDAALVLHHGKRQIAGVE